MHCHWSHNPGNQRRQRELGYERCVLIYADVETIIVSDIRDIKLIDNTLSDYEHKSSKKLVGCQLGAWRGWSILSNSAMRRWSRLLNSLRLDLVQISEWRRREIVWRAECSVSRTPNRGWECLLPFYHIIPSAHRFPIRLAYNRTAWYPTWFGVDAQVLHLVLRSAELRTRQAIPGDAHIDVGVTTSPVFPWW